MLICWYLAHGLDCDKDSGDTGGDGKRQLAGITQPQLASAVSLSFTSIFLLGCLAGNTSRTR